MTSLTAGWNDIFFVYDYLPPGETPEVASKQHGIAIFTDLPTPALIVHLSGMKDKG
jgi:AraC family transcriptional regulator